MGDYRKLDVWELASTFSDRIVRVVEKLPARMRVKIGDQLLRAADSIHEAIAEGCGLNSDPQLLKYLKVALGSANEAEDELLTLNRRGFLDESDQDLLEMIRRICAMLAKFILRVDPNEPINRRPSRPHDEADSRSRGRSQATDSRSRQRESGQPRADAASRGPQPSG